jgi:catechol 2,3-dioxygenase-like lactoylglutathione lyase family enzyme
MQPPLAELCLTHLNIDVRDLDASYNGALRVEHAQYLLVINAGEPKAGGTFHFGFRVACAAAVDAWIDRLRSYDVPILIEPERAGNVYVARVADPDGYQIEINDDV